MTKLQKINQAINDSRFTLYKDEGYFSFVFDDGVQYEHQSIYVYSINHLTLDRWIEEFNQFKMEVLRNGKVTTIS